MPILRQPVTAEFPARKLESGKFNRSPRDTVTDQELTARASVTGRPVKTETKKP